jgi:hypothetical protein
MLDEEEFLSPYGIRALSRHHLEHPYSMPVNDSAIRKLTPCPVWSETVPLKLTRIVGSFGGIRHFVIITILVNSTSYMQIEVSRAPPIEKGVRRLVLRLA